jgi:hypothetical protein
MLLSQVAALRMAFETTHQFLEQTVDGVTAEQARWQPPGLAHTIGATYGHVAFTEDAVVNAVVRGGAPLMAARFAGRTGASELPPPGPAWGEWASRVQVDVAAMREYANAVYAATDEYLGSIADGDLGREIDMGPAGKYPLGRLLTIMMGNVAWHTGEIACLKGLQGAKGYPV